MHVLGGEAKVVRTPRYVFEVPIEYSNVLLLGSSHSEHDGWWNEPSYPSHVLYHYRADIERLWGDEAVQAELKKRRLRLEESSGLSVPTLLLLMELIY